MSYVAQNINMIFITVKEKTEKACDNDFFIQ